MEPILVVSYILSNIALLLACINIIGGVIWLPNSKNITHNPIDNEIPVQDYVEILTSSRNAKDFERKLKKYIKRKNK